MIDFSKQTIEIEGTEYTLFLNRKGIVAWENITKVTKQAEKLQGKYKDMIKESDEPIEVNDNDNPFDYVNEEAVDDLEKDQKLLEDIYIKFYWIALYENHKLPMSKVEELFYKAQEEYGIEQLVGLANQMLEETNTDKFGKENKNVKKLKALKPTKR